MEISFQQRTLKEREREMREKKLQFITRGEKKGMWKGRMVSKAPETQMKNSANDKLAPAIYFDYVKSANRKFLICKHKNKFCHSLFQILPN